MPTFEWSLTSLTILSSALWRCCSFIFLHPTLLLSLWSVILFPLEVTCFIFLGQWFFSEISLYIFVLGNLLHIYPIVLMLCYYFLNYDIHFLSSSLHILIKNSRCFDSCLHISIFSLRLPISSSLVPAILGHFFSLILKCRVLSPPKHHFLSETGSVLGFWKCSLLLSAFSGGGNCPVCQISCLKPSVTACFLSFTFQDITGVEKRK